MMSPDTMTSTPGDPQEMNKMDTSESSAPLDDIPSSVDERMKRKNPFDDDEDEDSNKSAETKATNESSIEKQMNDFSEARTENGVKSMSRHNYRPWKMRRTKKTVCTQPFDFGRFDVDF